MIAAVFWDIPPCSSLETGRFHAGLFLGLFLDHGDGSDVLLRNVGFVRNALHNIPEDSTVHCVS
jgi:hypothetical protein